MKKHSSRGYRFLFERVIEGDLKSIADAISNGFDVLLTDQYGFSLLHRACANEQPEIAGLLIRSGADVSALGTDDWTPLHLTAASGAISCIDVLSEAQSPLDLTDKRGRTPLHLSVICRNPLVAKKLVEIGCDKLIEDHEGSTPLDHAIKKGRSDYFQYLV